MVLKIINFAGSLCVLLYGMKLMSDGIQKGAGQKLQKALAFVTGNRLVGLLTGMILTMVIQSSGATTVMVVTFVNAGLMTLQQSIGVIFGANIGTTITGWIVALFGFNFKIEMLAIPIFGLGYLLTIIKRIHKENVGHAIMGFALLFIGLGWLSDLFKNATGINDFVAKVQGFGAISTALAVVIGIAITALIHSSSAMTAIVITAAAKNPAIWEFGAAMVIGSEIGSTVDSIMAAANSKANAKRTALIHVLFNVATVIITLIFFKPYLHFVDFLVPGTVQENIVYHIAMLHTSFKVIGTILFIPFVNQIANLARKIIKDDKTEDEMVYHLEFNEKTALETPEALVFSAQKEIALMADIVVQMFDAVQWGFKHRDESFETEHYKDLLAQEDYTDQMNEQLTNYLVRCSRLDISEQSQNTVSIMMQIVQELESMADECLNIGMLIKKSVDKKMQFSSDDLERLMPYVELAREFLYFVYKNIGKHLNKNQLAYAEDLERQIDDERRRLKKIARSRLETGANVKAELLYIDLVRQIEKVGDRCFGIAGELAKNTTAPQAS